MRQNSGKAEVKAHKGRVQIRLPRSWFGGKQRFFSLLLPATPDNMAKGQRVATQINLDVEIGNFDFSLARYRPQQTLIGENFDKDLLELWGEYCSYKEPKWKPKTAHYNRVVIGRWIAKLPPDWRNSLAVRSYLMDNTTNGVTVRVLQSIETVLEWAMRVGKLDVQRNPYRKMAHELKDGSAAKKGANAFTPHEQARIIQSFYESVTWQYYAAFTEFLFLTGCRPSEAVGLQWSQIAAGYQYITFDRSIVRIGTTNHLNHLSKTNRSRVFPCNERLKTLLAEIRATSINDGAVFSARGQVINYHSYQDKPWPIVTGQIVDRKTTPYSARDSFITRQIEMGKPIALIAKWVDNSVAMIEKNYLDTTAILSIVPE